MENLYSSIRIDGEIHWSIVNNSQGICRTQGTMYDRYIPVYVARERTTSRVDVYRATKRACRSLFLLEDYTKSKYFHPHSCFSHRSLSFVVFLLSIYRQRPSLFQPRITHLCPAISQRGLLIPRVTSFQLLPRLSASAVIGSNADANMECAHAHEEKLLPISLFFFSFSFSALMKSLKQLMKYSD